MKDKRVILEPRIVCAANRHPTTGEIAIGVRHFCTQMHQNIRGLCARRGVKASDLNNEYAMGWRTSKQGFIDQFWKFHTREEAWVIADANGQIIQDRDWFTGSLHSEHLY